MNIDYLDKNNENIEKNKNDISSNLSKIDTNKSDISSNLIKINSNEDDILYNLSEIKYIKNNKSTQYLKTFIIFYFMNQKPKSILEIYFMKKYLMLMLV